MSNIVVNTGTATVPVADGTLTENGMPTNVSSGKNFVDFFFSMGASRNKDKSQIINQFQRSFSQMPLETTKAAFYSRDVREGQGERRLFRVVFRYLAQNEPDIARKNLRNVPEFGRWDDLLVSTEGTPVEKDAMDVISEALKNENGLTAKWMPREGKSQHKLANKLRKHLRLSWKEYRKLLSRLSSTVEDKMCAQDWDDIDYNKVPSIASNRYRNAFYRNDEERYKKWVDSLSDESSDTKVNAGAIYPHEIVRPFLASLSYWNRGRGLTNDNERRMLEAQWKALPNWIPEGHNVLPVCDVSGSMSSSAEGLPMEVCIALGLYISERNTGSFKDMFVTFSTNPQLQLITSDNLGDRVAELHGADWKMSTNLEATFHKILETAKRSGTPQEEMPDSVLILSDMQFNRAVGNSDDKAIEMIDRLYKKAGYKRPQLVFWNLNDSVGVPVKFDSNGTALVSGFSPSIMKRVLSGDSMNPLEVALDTVNDERYDVVTV